MLRFCCSREIGSDSIAPGRARNQRILSSASHLMTSRACQAPIGPRVRPWPCFRPGLVARQSSPCSNALIGVQVEGHRSSSPHRLGCSILGHEKVVESFSVLVKRWFAIPFHVVGVHIYGKRRDMPNSAIGVGGYVLKEHIPPPR